MMKKTLMIGLLSMSLAAFTLSGCGGGGDDSANSSAQGEQKEEEQQEEKDPIEEMKENMTKGYYFTENEAVASTGLRTFIHFSDDGTYYYIGFDGGYLDAGEWDLVEKEVTYTTPGEDGIYYAPNDADNGEATSQYAVEFKSYQDSLGTYYLAYADDKIQDANPGGLSSHNTFGHIADYNYDPAVDEIWPVAVKQARVGDDESLSITLYHDKSFEDFTGDTGVYGTWEKVSDTEYKLTTDDGKEAKIVFNGDTATYTNPDGQEVALTVFTKTIADYAAAEQ